MAIYVCPEINCPKASLKPNECPIHSKPFIRRVYKQDFSLSDRGDNDLTDILGGLFPKGKPGA